MNNRVKPSDVATMLLRKYGIYVPTVTLRKYEMVTGMKVNRHNNQRNYTTEQADQIQRLVLMRQLGLPLNATLSECTARIKSIVSMISAVNNIIRERSIRGKESFNDID